MFPASVEQTDRPAQQTITGQTTGAGLTPQARARVQQGRQNELIATAIDNKVAKPHAYSRSAMDQQVQSADRFLADAMGKQRPVVVYDSHGKRLHKSKAENYENAVVMMRSGVNGQAFSLITPPSGFAAPRDIGIPKEQRDTWGDGFRSVHIHPDHNAFYRALNVAAQFDTNDAFRSAVIALDNHPAASKDIEDMLGVDEGHKDVRAKMAEWLKSPAGKETAKSLLEEPMQPARKRSQAAIKPGAKVADEEIALAKSYVKKSLRFSADRDSAFMRMFLPRGDGADRSLVNRFRQANGISEKLTLKPMGNGSTKVSFYPNGKGRGNPVRTVAQFEGSEAVTKALLAMKQAGDASDSDVADARIRNARYDATDVDAFKAELSAQIQSFLDDDPSLAQKVNRHFADEVIPSRTQTLTPEEDPSAHFVGVRSLPVSNFFGGDYREMEEPQVNFLEIIKSPSPVKLPKEGPPIHVAVVGGGPSAAFLTYMYSKMAAESGREINLDVYEASPDRNKLGRFDTAIFSDGTTAEHGAMRFPPSSTLFWDAVREVVGENGLATTFPNHHVSSSLFSLRDTEGSRGKPMGGAESKTYSARLQPTIDYVLKKFEDISTNVDGQEISYSDIEDFLLNKPQERSPNRAAQMKRAFVQMCFEQNQTFGSFVENAVVEGIENGDLKVPQHLKAAYDNPGDDTPGGAVAKKLLSQAEMTKFMDVGKGTGGWGSYSKMSVVQELITRSINSTEEFFVQDLKKGNQDLGRRLRDKSRQIGGDNFTLNWQHGSRVIGLAKEPLGIDKARPEAWLEFSDVDKKSGAQTGQKHARSYDAILTTSSPAVMQKVTAPQSGGSGNRARITGLDQNGKRIDKTMEKPFRILAKSAGELDRIDPTLRENNSTVRKWMEYASMFGTTKVWFQITHDEYERLAPRDPNFVISNETSVRDVPARWVPVPIDEKDQYATSMELTPVGQTPPSSAQFQIGNRTYEWVKISQNRFDNLKADEPASEALKAVQSGGKVWLPVTPDRLQDFDLTEKDISDVYGQNQPTSREGEDQFVWMPVSDAYLDALTDDDPIKMRAESATLSRQKAGTYVVDKSFFEAVRETPPFDIDEAKLTPITTRSGQPGFFYSVPLDECEKFEAALAKDRQLEIKTAKTVPELDQIEQVYKVKTTGESPDAYQIVGGTRNCYVIKNPENNTATILEYNWDNDGNKIQPESSIRADTSVSNAHDLGHANSFLMGNEQNPLSELMGAAREVSTRNFMRDPNLLGAFSMLGVGDAVRRLPVSEYYKHALSFKYNPETFSPATIIPTGENASLNPGWVNPALARSLEAFIATGVSLGGELESDAAECFMMKPPLIGGSSLKGYQYPTFGLDAEIRAQQAMDQT